MVTTSSDAEKSYSLELPNVEYDEITYDHEIYKSVGSQNPSVAYVWISFPPIASENITNEELMKISVSGTQANVEEIKNNLLTYPPQNLISFSISRYLMGIGNFNLALYDNNYTEIESKLIDNRGVIAFKYGYANNEELASPWSIGIVTSYSLNFQLEGTYMSLTGLSTGWILNTTKEAKPFSGTKIAKDKTIQTTLISDYVRELAEENGFPEKQQVIEDTSSVYARGTALKGNEKSAVPLNATVSDTPFDHIINTLCPKASNKEGNGGYVFYIEATNIGPVLHFHTLEYLNTLKRKLFTLFKNPNTVVRSFQPDWAMALVQMQQGGKTSVISYDMANKKVIKTVVNSKEKVVPVTGGVLAPDIPVTPTSDKKVNFTIRSNGQSQSILDKEAMSNVTVQSSQAVSATLVIQGTPAITMLETVAVHVYIPKGPHSTRVDGGERLIHWISGDFKVTKITDKIDKGDYTTTLDLMFGGRDIITQNGTSFAVGRVSASTSET